MALPKRARPERSPTHRILTTDPTAYILSANVHRRHLTKGQQAMGTAMVYPEATKYKRGGSTNSSKNEELSKVSSGNLSMARYVLRNNFTPEGQQYPDRCLAVMAERIQARAIRRCGELLKQIEPGHGNRYTVEHDGADTLKNRTEAATQAGLSERQKVTALVSRVSLVGLFPHSQRISQNDLHDLLAGSQGS